MDWLAHAHSALSHLMASKLRSLLAMLGIVVGSGAVVALLSCGYMATEKALSEIKSLGTDVIGVRLLNKPGVDVQSQGLVYSEMAKISTASPYVEQAVPIIDVYKEIYASGVSMNSPVIGVDRAFYTVLKVPLLIGRQVTMLDKGQLYCVIGSSLAKKIQKQGVDPLLSQILIGNEMLTVVGIAKPWKPSMMFYDSVNDSVIVPLSTAALIAGDDEIKQLIFKLSGDDRIKQARQQIESTIAAVVPQRLPRVLDPQQIIGVATKQRATFTVLLTAIGGISLLVGGIGVMNIMLVSVIERRKEIGIRMAVGAQRSDIVKMFLMESITLTILGGAIGVVLGLLVSLALSFSSGWHYKFYLIPPVLGFFVSALVGVISGIYPALSASRLDPVQTFSD